MAEMDCPAREAALFCRFCSRAMYVTHLARAEMRRGFSWKCAGPGCWLFVMPNLMGRRTKRGAACLIGKR